MTFRCEQDFLDLIDRHFPDTPGSARPKRGDDCCIVPRGSNLCLSTDLFLDTVHFRRSYFHPEEIGYKALAVNISDVAAMGGVPKGFTMELMIPDNMPDDFWPRFLTGMSALARKHDLTLGGGDLSRSPNLGVGMTIWGEPGPSGRFLARGDARPGDLLFVVGKIGLARVGFYSLEESGNAARDAFPEATAAHLRPRPKVAEGLALASFPQVRGVMDISDGLARDLPRFLAQSQAKGADLDLSYCTSHPEVLLYAQNHARAPHEVVLLGGEDYGLLGACSPESLRALQASLPELTVIGTATNLPGLRLHGDPLTLPGFDHFTS
ncbi:MAG: thiamine-phosphate kinase [Desulfovibrionaceae bacterium]